MKTHLILLLVVILSVAGSLLPGGCASTETATREPVAPAPAPEPARPSPSASAPWVASRTYAGNDAVRLDLRMPNEVPLNGAFDYVLRVTNVADTPVADVVVTERLPRNFRLQNAEPAADKAGDNLVWKFDSLPAKATRDIKVSGVATSAETLTSCATVTYILPVCASVTVVEPKLMLAKTAPKEVLICDPIPCQIVVTNNGTGTVQGVKIVDTLPAGLQTVDGRSELVLDAGTLAPGQSKQFAGTFKASRTGEMVNRAVATAAGGLKAEAAATIVVRQPVLAITKTGPARHYLARPITYDITVTNKGDAPAANVVLEDVLPEGVQAVQTSPAGTASGGKVVWQLGALAVGASKKVSITCTPMKAGTITDTATASAVCAEPVTAVAKTAVYGIAAVLLEVIDTDDPVLLGGQTTYIITATNQGSKPSTNVQITCTLEDAMEFVSASGDTAAVATGKSIKFAPVPSLPAKAKATWRVVVKAVKQGDIRFHTTMLTAELERPVEETEATQLYE